MTQSSGTNLIEIWAFNRKYGGSIMLHSLCSMCYFQWCFNFWQQKKKFQFSAHKTGFDVKQRMFFSRSLKPYARTMQNSFITYIVQGRQLIELILMNKLAFSMRMFTLNHDFWVKDLKFIKQFFNIKSK